jgi:hypothetical protein
MADTSPELMKELSNLTASIRQLVGANHAEYNSVRKLVDVFDSTNDVLDDYEEQLTKGKDLTEDQNKLLQKALQAKRTELEYAKKLKVAQDTMLALQKKAKVAGGKDTEERNLLAKAMKQQRGAITGLKGAGAKATDGAVKAAAEFTATLVKVGQFLKFFGNILGFVFTSVLAQYEMQKKQMVANQGFIEGTGAITGMLAQQEQAIKMGIDPEAFAGITTEARQMINALGGTSKYTELLGDAQNALYAQTGNFAEALKAATAIAQSMIYSGFKPTKAAVAEYVEDIKNLSRLTGKSISELQSMVDEVAKDTDSLTLLRAAREDEREAILKSQRAIIEMGVNMGMSAEQAKEAAKMLNKMVAAKPIDRIKQAAKMRAFGAAFGIAGSEEAARGVIAGPRATAEQKKAIQQFNTNATNFADQARGAGLGTEIAVTTLLDKLDLDQYYGAGSTFSATLGTALKSNSDDVAKRYTDISKDGFAALVRGEEFIKRAGEWALFNGGWLAIIANHLKDISAYTVGLWDSITGGFSRLGDWFSNWGNLFSVWINRLIEAFGGVVAKIPGLGGIGESLVSSGRAGALSAIGNMVDTRKAATIAPNSQESFLQGKTNADINAVRTAAVVKDTADKQQAISDFRQKEHSDETAQKMLKVMEDQKAATVEGNKIAQQQLDRSSMTKEEAAEQQAIGKRMGNQQMGGVSYSGIASH